MKFHDELNQKLFNGEELKPEVKDKLNEIADAFIEFLEVPTDAIKDVVLTGSMMSYNYTKYSDIDLHLLVDFEKVHEDCPLVGNYLISKKSEFNKNHDIFIYGIPVEVYAESIDNDNVHNGLYSLKQDKWIDFPKKIEPTDNDAAVEAKFNEFKDLAEICDDSEVAVALIAKIKKMRKAGLAEGGEFSTENLTFKKLRDEGIIGKLMEIKKQGIDKQLSLESYNETNVEEIVDNLISTYGKEKLQKGLITPYQKDYIWGLLRREKGLDLTAILNSLKSKLNESIKEDISVSDYLKSLKDNGTLTDMEGAEYLVQSFNDGKLEVIAGYKDIEKAAKRFLDICGKYDKAVFKQLFDNGKDIKVLDSDHKELNEMPKHLSYVNESLFKKELTPLPKKKPSLKIGDEVKINGVNGKIIKLKDMKMSNTPVYQIKLENGKTVWRYEEELNESVKDVKGGWFDKIVTFENDNYKMECYIKGIKVASCYIIRKKDNNTIMQLIDPKYDKPLGLDEKCRAWNTLREYMQRMADRKNIQINFEEIEGMKEEFIIRKQSEFDGATEEEVGQADSELNAEEAGKKELKQMIADKKIAHPLIKIYKRDAETGNDTFVKDIKPIDLEENQVEESVDHLSDKIDYVNSQLKELIQSITRPEPVLAESYESLSAKIKQALGE